MSSAGSISNLPLKSISGMFSSKKGRDRFPKDCVDFAFDYVHRKYSDINFDRMNKEYDIHGGMKKEARHMCSVYIDYKGSEMEHKRVNYDLFPRFKRTSNWKKDSMSYDALSTTFATDILNNIFKYDVSMVKWDSIVLAIVMTSTFVRHLVDGNRSPKCVMAIFNGLYLAMNFLRNSIDRLNGWPCMCVHYQNCMKPKEHPNQLFSGAPAASIMAAPATV